MLSLTSLVFSDLRPITRTVRQHNIFQNMPVSSPIKDGVSCRIYSDLARRNIMGLELPRFNECSTMKILSCVMNLRSSVLLFQVFSRMLISNPQLIGWRSVSICLLQQRLHDYLRYTFTNSNSSFNLENVISAQESVERRFFPLRT